MWPFMMSTQSSVCSTGCQTGPSPCSVAASSTSSAWIVLGIGSHYCWGVLAAVYHGRNDIRVQEWPSPPSPAPRWVTVAVTYCGICGTDIEEYLHGPVVIPTTPHPLTGAHAPLVLGHEGAGVGGVGGGGGRIRHRAGHARRPREQRRLRALRRLPVRKQAALPSAGGDGPYVGWGPGEAGNI